MASRKEQKERARQARLDAEREAQLASKRAARRRLIGGVSLVLVAAVAGGAAIGLSQKTKRDKAEARTAAIANDTLPGIQATPPPWDPEYSEMAARIEKLDFPPGGDESYHVHSLLTVYVDGKKVDVPTDIGVDSSSSTMASLHTHDTSGVIHIESSRPFPFRLGDLFGVWGVQFTADSLGAYVPYKEERVWVYVNGKRVTQGPNYKIKAKDNVVVAYGAADSFPKLPPASALDDL